jgi:glycerol-3-phosphate dehydrogenase subunit B
MSRRILVIGTGIAATAAAFAARQKGHAVTVIGAGAGASALGGGAVDDIPWEQRLRASRVLGEPMRMGALPAGVGAFVEAFGLWEVPAEGGPVPLVATVAGRVRPARGRDRALLDLARLEGKTVLVPRAPRACWDADALAASLGEASLARRARVSFRAVDLPVLRFADEARIPDADLAMRHDEPGRLGWLAERLREGLGRGGGDAVLLGSWLGVRAPRAEALSAEVGVPVGEALVGVGGAAGLRFEAARDQLLATLGVEVVAERAVAMRPKDERVVVHLAHERDMITGDAVILAVGGVAGGGILYAPPEHAAGEDLPPRGGIPYALSLDAPVEMAMVTKGHMDIVASLQGPEMDLVTWPSEGRASALEAVGVRCVEGRVNEHVLAAGDVVAGRPRTLLEAVLSGLRAGDAA